MPPAPTKAGVPVITKANPPALRTGHTTVVSITGTGLDKVTAAKLSDARITAKLQPINATTLWLHLTAPADLPRGSYDLSLTSPAGESMKVKLQADSLLIGDQTDLHSMVTSIAEPKNFFGTLSATGQRDDFTITAEPGQTITLDLAAKSIGSKLPSARLELFDNNSPSRRLAASSGLDSGSDPFIAYTVPADAKAADGKSKQLFFDAQVSETTLQGGAENTYRLTIGALPIVVGWWPLAVQANAESEIHLVGYNLTKTTTTVKAPASGQITLPMDAPHYRSRVAMKVMVSDKPEISEQEHASSQPSTGDHGLPGRSGELPARRRSESTLTTNPSASPQPSASASTQATASARTSSTVIEQAHTPNSDELEARRNGLEGRDPRGASRSLPLAFNGLLHNPSSPDEPDIDDYEFPAKKGQALVLETQAATLGSPADTKIEVLDQQRRPIPRIQLRAVRDSVLSFRSVDANNPDIRVENWREMDLDQYLYFQGDVTRIFRAPRGPDGGFLFYSADAKRRAYFDTTATAHALDEPCYIVEPHPIGAELPSNGLPVFTLTHVNDDASDRRSGTDSRLFFTAPADGTYVLRVTDSRSLSGERLAYRATIREPQPDYRVALSIGDKGKTSLGLGTSTGFSIRATRIDGFEGQISIAISGVPAGFYASTPIVIQAGHELATGSLFAAPTASKTADWSRLKITATAMINGKPISHDSNGFGTIDLVEKPKLIAIFEPAVGERPANRPIVANTEPLTLTIAPGETKAAWLRVERNGRDELLNFDVHNLPFGMIVDNIGLSGVAVRAGETEREIFFTCAKWVPEQERLCHAAIISARAEQDSAGTQTSYPVLIRVKKAGAVVAK